MEPMEALEAPVDGGPLGWQDTQGVGALEVSLFSRQPSWMDQCLSLRQMYQSGLPQ